MTTEADVRVMGPHVKELQQSPEAARGKKWGDRKICSELRNKEIKTEKL